MNGFFVLIRELLNLRPDDLVQMPRSEVAIQQLCRSLLLEMGLGFGSLQRILL
jgi:hypothetical protein